MKAETKPLRDMTPELEALGLRPVTRWLPDTSDPAFIERYREQCAILAASAKAKSEMEWWQRLQTDEGWV